MNNSKPSILGVAIALALGVVLYGIGWKLFIADASTPTVTTPKAAQTTADQPKATAAPSGVPTTQYSKLGLKATAPYLPVQPDAKPRSTATSPYAAEFVGVFFCWALLVGMSTMTMITGFSSDLSGGNIRRHVFWLHDPKSPSPATAMAGLVGSTILLVVYLCARVHAGLTDPDNSFYAFWSTVASLNDALLRSGH